MWGVSFVFVSNKKQIWKFSGLRPGPFWGLTATPKPPAVLYLALLGPTFGPPQSFLHRYTPDNQVPPDESFELFDGDGNYLDVDYDEELESERDENNSENAKIQPSENIENDNVNTKEPNHYYRFWQKPIVLLPMPDEKYWKIVNVWMVLPKKH